jgi:hypothetical protein
MNSKKKLGKDKDYFPALFENDIGARRGGVYTANVAESHLWILDEEGNHFVAYANGRTEENIRAFANNSFEGSPDKPQTPKGMYDGNMHIQEDNRGAHHLMVGEPRLFIIYPDGCGSEFYSKTQLDYYFRIKRIPGYSLSCCEQFPGLPGVVLGSVEEVFVGSELVKMHCFLTQKKSMAARKKELTFLRDITLPNNVDSEELAPHEVNEFHDDEKREDGPDFTYIYRNLLERSDLSSQKRDIFFDDLTRFKAWKTSMTKQLTEFGIIDNRSEDDRQSDKRIILKIFRERQREKEVFDNEGFKQQQIKEFFLEEGTSKRFTQTIPEEQEETETGKKEEEEEALRAQKEAEDKKAASTKKTKKQKNLGGAFGQEGLQPGDTA